MKTWIVVVILIIINMVGIWIVHDVATLPVVYRSTSTNEVVKVVGWTKEGMPTRYHQRWAP